MGNYTKTLLIGCGGSGINTLIHLNKLLSSNPNYRNDVRENISYFVIDTSRKDLSDFAEKIKSQMAGAGLPAIKTCWISEGLDRLNQIVSRTFDTHESDSEDLKKLKTHWLCSPDGEPFRGINIDELEDGAGQCCQVSYLEAWNSMSQLDTELKELVNTIRNNNQDDVSGLQVFLVASLAGGTGRGSWQLIAFKVRQILQEQGISASITAIFFDASCFLNVIKRKGREQVVNTIVNSYTGMSELSTWLRLMDPASEPYYYSLPYLDNPSSNVIELDETDKDTANRSPIRKAFLIFSQNGKTPPLEEPDQYYRMAATALYSLTVYPSVIKALLSNQRINIGSLGATTFEVDTYHIRAFFETAVQKKFVELQCAELTNPDRAAEADQAVDQFLKNNSLWLPDSILSTSDGGVSLEPMKEDKIFSFLQKIFKEKIIDDYVRKVKVGEEEDSKSVYDYEELQKALDKNDNQAAQEVAADLLNSSAMDEDALTKDVNDVLKEIKLDSANLIPTLDNTVLAQFAPEREDVSLSRCILFTNKLKACFEKYIGVLNTGIDVEGMSSKCEKLNDLIDALKGVINNAYDTGSGLSGLINKLGVGNTFDSKEKAFIGDLFQYYMPAAIFFKLQPILVDFYTRAVKHLEEIANALNQMVEILKRTNNEIEKNLEPDFGKKSYDEIIKSFFINKDDLESIRDSIPAADSLQRMFYRQLKPIKSLQEINEILKDRQIVNIDKRPVMEEIGNQLKNLLDIHNSSIRHKVFNDFDSALKKLPRELAVLITRNVHLEERIGRETFMDKHFSFEEVLQNNIECWNKLLKQSGSTQRYNLQDQFTAFLGTTSNDYDDDNLLNDDVALREHIIASMVRLNKPWIQFAAGSNPARVCSILLPFSSEKKEIEGGSICCPGMNDNTLNLPSDRIVVLTVESIEDQKDYAPMDKVQNLTEWKKDSEIRDMLELAEGPRDEESSWFKCKNGRWGEKKRGFAFVSPIFENEPLKSLRWHPWQQEAPISMDEVQLAKAHKALFYAFLGNNLTDESVKKFLEDRGCNDPLISQGDKQVFSFNYPPRYFDGTKEMKISEANHTWEKGPLMPGINHLVDYLCGLGDFKHKEETGRFQESKEAGKKLCDALNAEAQEFFTCIDGCGNDVKRKLFSSLHSWLYRKLTEAREKDKIDVPYWEALEQFSLKESKERGIELR